MRLENSIPRDHWFASLRKASWCITVTLGMEFSIHTSHPCKIFIFCSLCRKRSIKSMRPRQGNLRRVFRVFVSCEALPRMWLIIWKWAWDFLIEAWLFFSHIMLFFISTARNAWQPFFVFGWLCWGLTSQSTIFQSYRDGAIASWVINQYFRGVKCLAQGHNTAAVGLEPRTSRSGVRHSTTEPPRSPIFFFFFFFVFAQEYKNAVCKTAASQTDWKKLEP